MRHVNIYDLTKNEIYSIADLVAGTSTWGVLPEEDARKMVLSDLDTVSIAIYDFCSNVGDTYFLIKDMATKDGAFVVLDSITRYFVTEDILHNWQKYN